MVAEALPCLARFSLKLFIAGWAFCSIFSVYCNILGLQMQVPNKNYKDITKKRLVGWVLLVVVWVMILSVFKSFMQTRRGFERLDEAGKRLLEVQQENEALKVKLQEVSSDEYKTRIVREKLRMQKGDEVVVVMPEESTVMGLNAEKADKENWRKWLELLI